jgi:ribulose 1,5-bisphosphate carboxylase large subunit-like protein
MIKVLSKIEKRDCVLLVHVYFDLEDFSSMEVEDIKDLVTSLVGNIKDIKISMGVKIYGTDSDKKIVKESTIFI